MQDMCTDEHEGEIAMKFAGLVSALAAGAAVTMLTAGPALAADPSLSISPKAGYVAKGAAVQVTVSATCSPYSPWWDSSTVYTSAGVTAHVTQAVKKGVIVTAGGSAQVPCDDQAHQVKILVVSSSSAFVRGPALVSGSLDSNDGMSTFFTTPTQSLTIK